MNRFTCIPLKQKILVVELFETKINQSYAFDYAGKNLRDQHILKDSMLILQSGTQILINGIRSTLTSSPLFKVSIYPAKGKMGSVYIEYEKLENLLWEYLPETVKKNRIDTTSIYVRLYEKFPDVSTIFVKAMGKNFNIQKIFSAIVNPLALNEAELSSESFCVKTNFDLGTVKIKTDKNYEDYVIKYEATYLFKLSIGTNTGLLTAIFDHLHLKLIAFDTYHNQKALPLNEYIFDAITSKDLSILKKENTKESLHKYFKNLYNK